MSRVYLILFILFITYGNCEAFIDNNEFSINLSARSYPFSGTLDAMVRSEKLLWDQREAAPWKFAMVQSKVMVASHGLVEAGLSVFPLGFLELGGSYSTTSRFYETKNFDCALVVCKGILTRSSLYSRLLIGTDFDFGTLFTLLGATQTTSKSFDDTKPFVDEVEKLMGKAGQDEINAQSFALGLKREEGTVLIVHRQGKYEFTKDKNEMTYLVYRKQIDALKINVGIGQYQSSRFASEFSSVFSIAYVDGVTSSLF